MSDDQPRLRHVQCLDARGLHRMAYWQWERTDGGADRVLVCVHGLSRQGRDFDTLARAMRDGWRVVCPDVVGRGESDRLADPNGYVLPTYVADMVTLLARLDAKTVHWFGTSMGGLIGMAIAGLPGSPISRLVLNDVGPAIDPVGIARIASYVGQPLDWASEDEAADYLLTISPGFGAHTREQWMALTRPMLRRAGDRWRLHYDPAIARGAARRHAGSRCCGRGCTLGGVRHHLVSDARRARRRLRRPRACDRGGDGRARPEGAHPRIRRRRPRADDRRARPGRRGAEVLPGRHVMRAPEER